MNMNQVFNIPSSYMTYNPELQHRCGDISLYTTLLYREKKLELTYQNFARSSKFMNLGSMG